MQETVSTGTLRRRTLAWLGYVAVAVALLFVASRITHTLTIFIVAAFITAGLLPIVRWLQRFVPRGVAIAGVYVGLLASLLVVALLVLPATLGEMQSLGINAPAYIASLQSTLAHTESLLHARFGRSYLPAGYNSLTDWLAAQTASSLNVIFASVTSIFVGTATVAFVVLSAIVLSAFFVLQGAEVAESIYRAIPARRRPGARLLGAELARVFGGFVAGQTVLCFLTGTAVFVISALAGFKFALLLGIISGIAYAVPFVGMIFAQVVAAVLALPQGGSMVLWVSIIVFVVARIADNLLVPKIMSESVGVSPIVVMFAVFAGGELFGLPGLVLGIPAAALAKVAWKFFSEPAVAETAAAATGAGTSDVKVDVTVSVPVEQARVA